MPQIPSQIQVCIETGLIDPDNGENAFGDYNRLLVIHVRTVNETKPAPEGGTLYAMYGDKRERPVVMPIDKPQADALMIAAYRAKMERRVLTIDQAPKDERPY